MMSEDEIETIEVEKLAGELIDTIGAVRTVITTEEGRIVKKRLRQVYVASCGHVVRSSEELGGKCMYKDCNAICCSSCLKLCSRCMKAICPKHQKLHNGFILCPRCKIIALFFGFKGTREQETGSEKESTLRKILAKLFSGR
jgi:hypothetical protein